MNMNDLYTYKNFGDREIADQMNESQLGESGTLASSMREHLDVIIERLPDSFAGINQLMDAMPDLNLELIDARRINDGAWEIVTSGLTYHKRVKPQYFRVQYAGHKSPHYYDIFVSDMAAWGGGRTLMYSGLVSGDDIPRELAIYTHRMQVPGSVMCR